MSGMTDHTQPITPGFQGASGIGQMELTAVTVSAAVEHTWTAPWVSSRGKPVELTPSQPVARPYAVWATVADQAVLVACDRCGEPYGPLPSVRDDLYHDTRLAALDAGWKWRKDLGFACPACVATRTAELESIGRAGWDDGPGTEEYEKRLRGQVSCYCDPDSAEGKREMDRLRIADLIALARPADPDTVTLKAVA